MNDIEKLQNVRLESIKKNKKYLLADGQPNFNFFSHRNCPVCSSNHNNLLYINDSLTNFVKCSNCGMVYMSPALIEKYINDTYLNSKELTAKHQCWNKSINQLKPSIHPAKSDRFDLMLKYSKRGSLLDFGCGFGKVTDKLKFYFDSVEGIEIDSFCAHHAEKIYGFKIHKEFIEYLDFENKYDCVVNYNNIEHMYKPKEIFKYLNKALKNNGLIYIECPNVDSLSINLFKGKHHLLQSNEHLNMFGKETITRCLNESGFKVLEIRTRKLDIKLNELLVWIFNKNKFMHRCTSPLLNESKIYHLLTEKLDFIFNKLFNLTNNNLFSKGSYIQVVASKI